jgi:hypothetical protein
VKTKLPLPIVTKTKIASTEVKPFPVDHYSASSMVKFSTNPILFKIQYVNRDIFETAQNISGVIGKAFHQAMEVYYGGSDTLIPTNEAEAIEFGLKAGMSFLENYDDGFIKWSKDVPGKQKAYDLLAFAFNAYVQENPYQPDTLLGVEMQIKETIDIEWRGERLTMPVPLKGYLDKIVRDDGKIKVVDYKTTRAFANPDKIDGGKMLQAVEYFLLAYAHFGEAPYSITFEEVKLTKNSDGTSQVRRYEVVFADNPLYFDFFFRFYEDVTRALNGEAVFVPNVNALYDNEVAIVSYIHRLDIEAETAALMKKHHVSNITELLKKQIQTAGNMRKLMKSVEEQFVSAKNLNYDTMKNEEKIRVKMMEHGMVLQFDSLIEGATVDLYRYTPSIGLKMSRVLSYVADVEQVMGVSGIRVLAPIPNTSFVGFEVPRKVRSFPSLPAGSGFDIAIGQTIEGEARRFDIRQAPHILVAGASGAGKSVWLSGAIVQLNSLAKSKAELHLFDPKLVELAHHEDDKNVVEYETDPDIIGNSLHALVKLMNARYARMKKAKVKNIDQTDMPYKFVIIDEFGDLMARGGEMIEHSILLLAQKGRAAGIHLIIATQRPSVDVVKGTIKANFPTKVVFRTAKAVDSQVILDEAGAEKLVGKGDMLFASDAGIERLQGYNL